MTVLKALAETAWPDCDPHRSGRGHVIVACPHGCVTECRREYEIRRHHERAIEKYEAQGQSQMAYWHRQKIEELESACRRAEGDGVGSASGGEGSSADPSPEFALGYKAARGAVPYKDGDPLPEDLVRESR